MNDKYIPFGRPNFSDREIEAVARVMRTSWVGMGPETIEFEKELASHLHAPYVVAVNSCTSALFLSLLVSGVGVGDEVICPSLTWCSTASVVLHLGAKVVFCDVDPGTLCVTVDSILEQVTPRTKAVMVVHFGGLAVDVVAMRKRLPPHVAIIEDAAHALGSTYPDAMPVGSAGNLTCFSFYANKNLSTGEGGAIALGNEEMARRLVVLRQNGMTADAWKRYSVPQAAFLPELVELGYKMNFTDLQACIGRVQLRRQPEFVAIRRGIANLYLERLASMPKPVGWQVGLERGSHARHLFVVKLPVGQMTLSRNDFVLALRARNVGASVHYAPLHTTALYRSINPLVRLPRTEKLASEIMTLPISAGMTLTDAHYIIDQMNAVLRQA